jgi:hypothetical protein
MERDEGREMEREIWRERDEGREMQREEEMVCV